MGSQATHQERTVESLSYQSSDQDNCPDASSNWAVLPVSQYVSARDQQAYQTKFQVFQSRPVNPGDTLRLILKDSHNETTFSEEVKLSPEHPPGTTTKVHLDFSRQLPGFYRLFVNERPNPESQFVLKPLFANQSSLALVEIFLDQTRVPDSFSPLNQSSEEETIIAPKDYVIRFNSRRTRWRYYTEVGHGFCLAKESPDTDCQEIDSGFEVIDRQRYASLKPLELRDCPINPLKIGDRNLPFPRANIIKPILKTKSNSDSYIEAIFSDIYL